MGCPTIKLNSGGEMPVFGLGTYLSKPGEVKNAVITAIKAGYRCFDCAMAYDNEFEIGEALKELIPSYCKREEIFITTKLTITDFEPDEVESALNVSLHRLGLSYVDLYLVHQPVKSAPIVPKRDPLDYKNWNRGFGDPNTNMVYSPEWFIPVWQILECCYEKGLTKSIGISNFSIKMIESFIHKIKVIPSINQIETHPGLNNEELIDYCKSKNINIMAYFPLGNPVFSSTTKNPIDLLNHPVIKSVSDNHRKTTAQILLRWGVQRGTIVIPKSVTNERIISNLNIFDFKLSDDEMKKINDMECGYRINIGMSFFTDQEKLAKYIE